MNAPGRDLAAFALHYALALAFCALCALTWIAFDAVLGLLR